MRNRWLAIASHFGQVFDGSWRNLLVRYVWSRKSLARRCAPLAQLFAYACAFTYMARVTLTSRYIRTIAARTTNCAVCSDCRHALLLCRTIRRVVRLHTGCRSFLGKSFVSFFFLLSAVRRPHGLLDNGSFTCCGKRTSSGFVEAISRTRLRWW